MIDWVIAEKVAAYVAGTGDARPPQVDLLALKAESERRVVQYTGLEPVNALPAPEGVSRREWVSSNIRSTRALLDPVMDRAGRSLRRAGPFPQLAAGALLSLEIGVVVGYLGQRVLGQYELVLLDEAAEDHPPRLLFVLPNLGQALSSFEADEREFMTWVALHEVTHAVQFGGVPWLHGHLAGLVRELLRSAELRLDTSRKRGLPSRSELRRIGEALRKGDIFGVVMNRSERETIDRVQAVMAVIEGHAEHVMDAVAPDLIPSLPRLRRALNARRRTQSTLSRLVGRLLGLELKLRQYERGKQFCDAIVAGGGEGALRHVFSAPEALPTLAEIEDPAAWLSRTATARAAA
ncbi:MAG TPA: zinc-dependent metalloprotease [Solirubrobacteraceae bacterium]|nr:zinc-dependent metalloprotease [Solirubrobacteraceae bacterium]